MEENKHIQWFQELDHVLAEQDEVLAGLQKAVEENGLDPLEAEEYYRQYVTNRDASEPPIGQ